MCRWAITISHRFLRLWICRWERGLDCFNKMIKSMIHYLLLILICGLWDFHAGLRDCLELLSKALEKLPQVLLCVRLGSLCGPPSHRPCDFDSVEVEHGAGGCSHLGPLSKRWSKVHVDWSFDRSDCRGVNSRIGLAFVPPGLSRGLRFLFDVTTWITISTYTVIPSNDMKYWPPFLQLFFCFQHTSQACPLGPEHITSFHAELMEN